MYLLSRNLRYHVRGNLAVLLGAAVGCSVLTGALLVGDSLRGSLRARTERQLAGIDSALVGPRFIRADVARQLPGEVRGAILLQGAVTPEEAGRPGQPSADFSETDAEGGRRVGKVSVWGVDGRFGIKSPDLDTDKPIAILSTDLARNLGVRKGDSVWVDVQKSGGITPRASLVGKRGAADSTRRFRLVVHSILSEADAPNALSLSIAPTLPSNLFIPIARLQQEIGQEGKINTLLAGQSAQSLQPELARLLNLDDWGVKVRVAEFRGKYLNVESPRLLLEPAVVQAAEKTARELGYRSARTYTYLANSISHGTKEIPYAIVAALDPALPEPLGPFLPEGVKSLEKDDIVLVDWKESPIRIDPNVKNPQITLRYFLPEIEGRIQEADAVFNYRGTIPLAGASNDRDLTPEIPGVTNRTTLDNWNPPFPVDQQRFTEADKDYWKKYRTAPKAFVRLEDGQRIWGSRFGNVTTLRVVPPPGVPLDEAREAFAAALLKNLDPESVGLAFQPIRERMLAAGKGSTDFGMLFLSFSFFLIVAALMLVGLLFRLNLDRRASEVGLLRATGFPLSKVRRLLLLEGTILSAIGAALGVAGALAYAQGMVRLMVSLWPTPGVDSFLKLHVTFESLALGFGAALGMSVGAILFALRSLNRLSPVNLLKGDTSQPLSGSRSRRPSRWPRRIAIVALVCAIGLAAAGPSMPPGEPQAGAFFGAGAMLLTAGLTILWAWLTRPRYAQIHGQGAPAFIRLGARNMVRNPTRSILTAGLLASAAFLLVAVESFRRETDRDFLNKKGGSGGFTLIGESATPIDFDINDDDGRFEIREALKRRYQDLGLGGEERERKADQAMASLPSAGSTWVHRFRVHGGDDASCLNLYQASRPRIFGVPASIVERGGFQIRATLGEEDNPWKQLKLPADPNEPIPCIVEQNTAVWMLKKGLGDIFETVDQENRPLKLRIVAMLKDSVFQSEVLIADAAFRRHFPSTEGFAFFLLDVPPEQEKSAARVLEAGLAGYGFETTASRDRVAAYLSVQNTYLTTFQLLGAFGLLLGVFGLSVVLLRGIWERRAELALLRALGYRSRVLNGIVLAENSALLLIGLAAGVAAALAGVLPHLVSGGHVPWGRLGVMLGAVIVIGLGVAAAAVLSALRSPLIGSLRDAD